ncbi:MULTISPECIES: hypothetical protein [Rhodobacterales]|uniref:Uncharacterized protein n=1 Tax=Rhodophyticola porphyridii TaxID=1852017 RepID=A0A3L9Y0X0_9RHOB|nr:MULTISPECIES: hypothetical protein [Paracoccaceae]MBO6605126.1 hypothetical protein [Roseicyclus sp.]MBO6624071.1 hypothetical protein [Roseicyclus sp.]MBO6923929.1 hypothetical protein [Roseicyclus sp.]RMA40747.1 hypothetical protein D9R08_18140 [Rhodophyticola porphyridii]
MPNLPILCLRYLLWLVGVTLVFLLAVNLAGLPLGPATQVILASAPAIEIAANAIRRAGVIPPFRAWVQLWAAMFAVYVLLELVFIATFAPQLFGILARMAEGSQGYLIARAMVLPMLALFLYLGVRSERARPGR